jgi:hypothetical protein
MANAFLVIALPLSQDLRRELISRVHVVNKGVARGAKKDDVRPVVPSRKR